jgi:hypothetical protein
MTQGSYLREWYSAIFQYIVFQVEFDPPPSPPIHIFLPSGIEVIGIHSWVERFTKIFQNVGHNQKYHTTDPTVTNISSQLPKIITCQYSVGD